MCNQKGDGSSLAFTPWCGPKGPMAWACCKSGVTQERAHSGTAEHYQFALAPLGEVIVYVGATCESC